MLNLRPITKATQYFYTKAYEAVQYMQGCTSTVRSNFHPNACKCVTDKYGATFNSTFYLGQAQSSKDAKPDCEVCAGTGFEPTNEGELDLTVFNREANLDG